MALSFTSKMKKLTEAKAKAAGCVPVLGLDPEGAQKVWVRKVKENPGFPAQWTFPKGRVEAGDTLEQTAVKETKEEAGLKATPHGAPLGKYEGSVTETTYYLAVAPGPSSGHDDETAEVRLVTWEEARKLFKSLTPNTRDQKVLEDAVKRLKEMGLDPEPVTPPGDKVKAPDGAPQESTKAPPGASAKSTALQAAMLKGLRRSVALFREQLKGYDSVASRVEAGVTNSLHSLHTALADFEEDLKKLG